MRQDSFLRWLFVILAFALIILLAGGAWFYREQDDQLRQRAEHELEAVAQLKTDEITRWRMERLGDAGVLTESPLFLEGVLHWIANPQAESTESILAQFRAIQKNYHYDDVVLVGVDGTKRLSLSRNPGPLQEAALQTLAAALHGHQPMLTDLHPGPGDMPPHIDVIAPLFANNEPSAEPIGAVILQSNASQFLYPLIQSWPTPSSSAETLLVRRDGNTVLFLNELRLRQGAALTLRIPLDQTDVLAVKAVLGIEGIAQGKDYRGVDVLGAIATIPDTPWFLVAKVDETEVFADLRLYAPLLAGLLLGALMAVGMTAGAVWQRNQKVHYQALLQAEKAHQESEARYQTTLLSIGDGVIVTDADERVVLLNSVAEALTGWTQDEARGQPLEAIFCIINEDTRQAVENPARRVRRDGIMVGLANHTVLIAKDGREIPIADSGAPIQTTHNLFTGVVLVFRDQTEERVAQKALRDSEAYLRTILDNLPFGVAVNSVMPAVSFRYINDNFVRYYRTTREALADTDSFWEVVYEDPEFRETMRQRILEDVASGDPERMHWEDVPITRQGAETTFVSARNRPIQGMPLMLSTVWDTTARKRAEEALHESERFAFSTLNSLSAHLAILDETGNILSVNNSWRRFAEANPPITTNMSEGANYLAVCDQATGSSSEDAAAFATGIRAVLSGERDHFEMEYACHSPTEQRWFVGRVTRFPGEGLVRVVVAHESTTQAKLAELQLAEERNLLRTLIDNLPDRIYVKDREGRFLLKNLVDVRQMGAITTDEVIGKTDFDYYPRELAVQYDADDLAVIESGRPLINREERVIDARGTEGWILTSKVPLRDSRGQVIGLVGIGHDVSERKRAQEALRASEEKYRSVVQQATDGIAIMDRQGLILEWNSTLADISGFQPDQARGKYLWDILFQLTPPDLRIPDTLQQVKDSVLQIGAEGSPSWPTQAVVHEIERSDGTRRIVETRSYPIRLETTFLLGSSTRDITERKRAEEAEREQRALAEALRDAAEALVRSLDPEVVMARILENIGHVVPHDTCNIMLIRDNTAQVIYCQGWSPADEAAIRAIHFPLDTANLWEMMQTRAPLFISDTAADPGWILPDRPTRSYVGAPILIHGNVIGFLSLDSNQPGFYTARDAERLGAFAVQAAVALENAQLYDEIQRHATELESRVEQRTAELSRTKEHVEAILNNTSDAIVVTRVDGTIEQTNPAFASFLGYPSDEAIRLPFIALIAPGQVEAIQKAFQIVCIDASPQRLETVLRRRDGTNLDVEAALSPIFGPDRKPSKVVCILHDIGQRKRVEKDLQALNQMKTEFLSTAAHELRTPLTGIRGFSELLLTRTLVPERHQRYLELINEQATQLGQLIDDLLDISRMEAKRSLALTLGAINLAQLVDEVLMPVVETAPNHHIQVQSLQACPPLIGDSFRLGQVFRNLLSNAIKYSPKGGTITISVQLIPDYVQVSVKDEGTGMTPEQQAHLFEKFYRANTTIAGTGLGLAVCKSIIELHGGRIWVESEYGVGTTFHFTLPLSHTSP